MSIVQRVAQPPISALTRLRLRPDPNAPPRSAPFDQEPGYYAPSCLWLFGNVKVLCADLAYVAACATPNPSPHELDAIEVEAEEHVLAGKILVCGVHSPAHQRAAVVPLRWGSPRIVVFSGGFRHHLGPSLRDEPFRAGRLWRYQWDSKTDLAVSRRGPDKRPTFGQHNPTVDRMIAVLASRQWPGIHTAIDKLTPALAD